MLKWLTRLASHAGLYPSLMDENRLKGFVASCLRHRDVLLRLVHDNGSPLYAVDEARLRTQAKRFRAAFEARIDKVGIFFALKSNNMPQITRIMVDEGLGADVSSGFELDQACWAGAEEILFSGPGKTDKELTAAISEADRVTVLMDSFGELCRLDRLTRHRGRKIRAGVRLDTDPGGVWRKFGIPLSSLETFFQEALKAPFVDLAGLQFHTSWNLSPSAQTTFIAQLGHVIGNLPGNIRKSIRFLDVGGGFWPEEGEWLRASGTSLGQFMKTLFPRSPDVSSRFCLESRPIDHFADEIALALNAALPDSMDCRIFFEPGRWLSHEGLHLILTVVDVKAEDLAITDAGTNAVGWERFEHDYFPVINLTHPCTQEHSCSVLGSLCTPHDVWGYSYYGSELQPGDVLLIPNQGAYTYSLKQNFIKPLPQVAMLNEEMHLDWKSSS